MVRARKRLPTTPDPKYFFALGYRIAQIYGLREHSPPSSRPELLAWFATGGQVEQVDVYADCIIVTIEDGTSHRLIIDDA